MTESKSTLFKQRLFRLHVAAGITFSLIMYIAIFFGIFAIFLPYIQTWEKPSRYIENVDITQVDYNHMINEVLKDPDFPQDNILVNLPGRMGDTLVGVSNQFVQPKFFNPISSVQIQNESAEITHLASFLNGLHYGKPLKSIGEVIFGFGAIGTMFLLVTGLMLILFYKFRFKANNTQSLFSTIHVKIFTWLFLPFFLITLTGSIMTVGLVSAGPMSQFLTKGEAKSIDEVVGTVLFPRNKPAKKENKTVTMLPLSELLIEAQKINPELTFKQIKVFNWNDSTARAEFIGYNPYKPFLNGGIFNIPYVALNIHTGELLQNKKVLDNAFPVFVAESLFFLHFLFGIDIFSRIAVALMMALCGVAIGFGVMLWLEKKAKRFGDKITFYHWMGKFSLTIMIGVIPATAMLFLSQWILPFDLVDRVLWQKGIFYNVWLFTLFWSFYRINSYQASKEFFMAGGVLFIVAMFLHSIKFISIPLSINIIAVDVALGLFGVLLILIAKKLPANRNEFRFINKKGK